MLSDLQLLGRLKDLSWLSIAQINSLNQSMNARDVETRGLIFEEKGKLALDTHILLSGTAQLNHVAEARSRALAIQAPGVIFRVPLMPLEVGHNFRWTALSTCRVAELPTKRFVDITLGIRLADFERVAYGGSARLGSLLARYPSFLGFSLLQRVAVALIELALEFGVRETRGALLQIPITQTQLAGLVGGSRPKVGRVLNELERRRLIAREGRRFAVVVPGLRALLRY